MAPDWERERQRQRERIKKMCPRGKKTSRHSSSVLNSECEIRPEAAAAERTTRLLYPDSGQDPKAGLISCGDNFSSFDPIIHIP